MKNNNKFPKEISSNVFVKYIDRSEIKGLVGSLGHTISKKYEGQELIILAILKGSVIFLADLVREVRNVNIKLDFVSVDSFGKDKEKETTICFKKDIAIDITDKHVLIVEEIIDTGRAVKFLIDRVKLNHPKSINLITLFDKPYKRTSNLSPDHIGKKIDDQFIVGYGLDLEEFGRNLEDIYFLKYPQ